MRKDTIISGSLAGILGNIPKTIISWIFYLLGYVDYTFDHIAAGYFVETKYLETPIAVIIGFIADNTLAAVLGVLLYLILKFTGTDYAVLKGLGFGSLTYILFFGVAMALDFTRTSLMKPLDNLLPFFPHIIFGILSAWIIKKYILKVRT